MKIGIMDSGIGGLSVLSATIKLLPDAEYYYYADTEHVPYGEKTKEQIFEYTKNAVDFLLENKCDIICIACNTATSVAAKRLREIITTPILGVEPAVKPALEACKKGRILVLATPVTVHEKKLHDLIEKYDDRHRVDAIGLGKLPVFAEKGIFEGQEVKDYLAQEFSNIDLQEYAGVVLGCTHFIHYQPLLEKFFNEATVFLDGSEGTARNIKRKAELMGLEDSQNPDISFYQTGKKVDKNADSEVYEFFSSVLERLK